MPRTRDCPNESFQDSRRLAFGQRRRRYGSTFRPPRKSLCLPMIEDDHPNANEKGFRPASRRDKDTCDCASIIFIR
jgi:hypothetical protein